MILHILQGMKNALLSAFATFVVGFGGTIAVVKKMGLGSDTGALQIANMPTLRQLPNGTVIYEQLPGTTDIRDIAPAAGDGDNDPAKPVFKYDPLTQTFRAPGRKEILNTNN
jgi:hypothetical protein